MNLEESIEKIVRSHGAEFYDTETVQENDQTIYRVYITRKAGSIWTPAPRSPTTSLPCWMSILPSAATTSWR